jgi:hypothetical protein
MRQIGEENMTLKTIGGAAAALLLLVAPASAEDLAFLLTNASSYAVKSFYTSPVDVNQWEEDVFGENYLPAGNQVTITISDGRAVCVYDMKFVLEDDSEFIENGIDLCETGEYTLSDAQ